MRLLVVPVQVIRNCKDDLSGGRFDANGINGVRLLNRHSSYLSRTLNVDFGRWYLRTPWQPGILSSNAACRPSRSRPTIGNGRDRLGRLRTRRAPRYTAIAQDSFSVEQPTHGYSSAEWNAVYRGDEPAQPEPGLVDQRFGSCVAPPEKATRAMPLLGFRIEVARRCSREHPEVS
jgi:hypothetical protein